MEPDRIFDECLENTVHKETQVDERGVHLTVSEIGKIHRHGDVDFGGSEMKSASTHAVEALEHQPGDQYGWWRLPAGRYLVKFNEVIKEGSPAMLLVSNDRLLATGCTLASAVVGPGEVQSVLDVPDCGTRIKENARIALLMG